MCTQKKIADSDKRTKCDVSNIGYEGDCLRCNDVVYKYVGKTSRTAYTQVREHFSNYRVAAAANLLAQPPGNDSDRLGKPVKSWMWEQTRDVHGGQIGEQGGVSDYKFQA